MNYNKPDIIVNIDLAEGVFAASGAKCYTTTAKIHQTPCYGDGYYKIQVDGHHNGDHTNSEQTLVITFNQPVTYKKHCGRELIDGDGTCTLTIRLKYWQNPTDNIGFGDLVVKSTQGLSIVSAEIYD